MIHIAPELLPYADHIQRICAELGITSVYFTMSMWGCVAAEHGLVEIDLRQIERLALHPVRVIAHELKHIQQYQQGRLAFTEKSGRRCLQWFDGTTSGNDWRFVRGAYYALPWELEANLYCAEYMRTHGAGLAESEAARAAYQAEYIDDALAYIAQQQCATAA